MKIIIGYGNELRGEDAFGIDVIKKLKRFSLKNTELFTVYQLTPELCPSLLKANIIIFVDAAYNSRYQYELACSINKNLTQSLSHQISPHIIMEILNKLYNHHPKYYIYSMLTDSFEQIWNKKKYESSINKIIKELR